MLYLYLDSDLEVHGKFQCDIEDFRQFFRNVCTDPDILMIRCYLDDGSEYFWQKSMATRGSISDYGQWYRKFSGQALGTNYDFGWLKCSSPS